MSLLLSKDRCWYVKTDERTPNEVAFTYAEAILIADLLVANKHTGVEIYRGQLHMEIK